MFALVFAAKLIADAWISAHIFFFLAELCLVNFWVVPLLKLSKLAPGFIGPLQTLSRHIKCTTNLWGVIHYSKALNIFTQICKQGECLPASHIQLLQHVAEMKRAAFKMEWFFFPLILLKYFTLFSLIVLNVQCEGLNPSDYIVYWTLRRAPNRKSAGGF